MRYGYFVTHYWMIQELGLKGNEVQVYAIIYGFSQDGTSEFSGSASYLADFTCANRTTVMRSLKSLVEKGFIDKREYYPLANNKMKLCAYKANIDALKFLTNGGESNDAQLQNAQEGVAKCTEPCSKMQHNNINNIINNNIVCVRTLGSANNIKLTETEIEKLKEQLPDSWENLVEDLSLAKAGKGYKNKSDYYTILSWARLDQKKADAKKEDELPF